jgi:heterodisulfide reductase subunit C
MCYNIYKKGKVIMKVVNRYEAIDGTIFDNEEQCLEYEKAYKMNVGIAKFTDIVSLVRDNPSIIEFLNMMRDYCKMQEDCDNCFLCDSNCPIAEYPYEWKVDKFVKFVDKFNKEHNVI